jgi:type II secretory pathway pseudopilin PulG
MKKDAVFNMSREEGFSIVEMMVATTVMLLVIGAALTTFQNALKINDTAALMADANQNLRAGTNQLVRDLLMAGRIIGTEGIPMPTGSGITYKRPAPGGIALDFLISADTAAPAQLPSISTGWKKGPIIKSSPTDIGSTTDIVTIMTVDEFMPTVTTPPLASAPLDEATLSPDGTFVTFGVASHWMDGDTAADTPKIKVGDLVLYVGVNGKAIQTVTRVDTSGHRIYFDAGDALNDFFHFNQPSATTQVAGVSTRPLASMKGAPLGAWTNQVTLFKALMVTYYVDDTTTGPRLTRVVNNFEVQSLAGVVERLDLTYDLYDGDKNPTRVLSLPSVGGSPECLEGSPGVTYSANLIRKVNVDVGVRSELKSKPMQDYVRNHISTSVNVRSLAAVDRYPQ